MILIVEQEDKHGFGMYKLDKPFMGECTQTENVNKILERVLEVGFQGVYRKLRKMGEDLNCEYFADVILTMIDAQDVINTADADRREMSGEDNFTDYGRRIEYGKKSKSYHHRTPDGEAARQQRIRFNESDIETAEEEVNHDT
jgi:hypothetical protein